MLVTSQWLIPFERWRLFLSPLSFCQVALQFQLTLTMTLNSIHCEGFIDLKHLILDLLFTPYPPAFVWGINIHTRTARSKSYSLKQARQSYHRDQYKSITHTKVVLSYFYLFMLETLTACFMGKHPSQQAASTSAGGRAEREALCLGNQDRDICIRCLKKTKGIRNIFV